MPSAVPFRFIPLAGAPLAALCSLAAVPAAAQPAAPAGAQTVRDYDLPAAPLGATLNRIAREAGLALTVDAQLVSGRSAAPVRGRLDAPQALAHALTGSGLELRRTDAGSYTLRPTAPATVAAVPVVATARATPTLGEVRVMAEADREVANGPVRGLVARRSATGSKTDTPIIETPQTLSVIPAEQLELLKPRDLAEALTYTAGISRAAYVDRVADQFVLRGFGGNAPYRDGMRFQVGIYDGQMEPYGLERIEVLKGAGSTLYGTLPPGGMVNTVSKQPTVEPLREVGVDLGSFNRKQLSADFGGALTADGDWSYRLTVLQRDSGTSVDYGKDDRSFVSAALRWQPSAATSLTLRAEYQRDHTIYTPGYPVYGTVLPSPYGEVPQSRFIGEPGFDGFHVNRKVAGYQLEHAFNDALTLRHGLRFYQGDIHRREAQARNYYGFTSDQRTFTRRGHERYQTSKGVTMDTSLQYKAQTGDIRHTAIVGVDYSRTTWRDEYYIYTMTDQDLFQPVYGGAMGAVQRLDDSWGTRNIRQLGVYAQDQMKIGGRWVVLAGGRQDQVRYDDSNPLTGEVTADGEKSHKFSGRLGAVYLGDHGVAPFAGFSQSFQPQAGTDRVGNRFKPTEGAQFEAGVRWQPQGTDTLVSAALFQLTQKNLTVTDPDDTRYSAQLGRVRSRGFELEARTRIGRNANLIAAYAYTDARTIESSPLSPQEKDQRSALTPYNQLSAWADYGFGAWGLPGLRVGAGARYTGESREQNGTLSVPAYTLLDAMASYTAGPWKLALNVKNLADKRHITACSSRTCFLGEPRTVVTSATYRW